MGSPYKIAYYKALFTERNNALSTLEIIKANISIYKQSINTWTKSPDNDIKTKNLIKLNKSLNSYVDLETKFTQRITQLEKILDKEYPQWKNKFFNKL